MSMLDVADKFGDPPKSLDELGGFFYFRITNTKTISKRIMIIKEEIKQIFLTSYHLLSARNEAPLNY